MNSEHAMRAPMARLGLVLPLLLAALLPAPGRAAEPLERWLQSTPNTFATGGTGNGWPYACPTLVAQDTPQTPFFGFNFAVTQVAACLQDGPYTGWQSGSASWYVQRIQRHCEAGEPSCKEEAITRVCSKAGTVDVAPNGLSSPCGKTGPKGCAVCVP